MATHQKVSFREVDALYVLDISYTGWWLVMVLRANFSLDFVWSVATITGFYSSTEWKNEFRPHITAPWCNAASNRIRYRLCLCYGGTAPSCHPLCDAVGSFEHVTRNSCAATHNGNVWQLMMVIFNAFFKIDIMLLACDKEFNNKRWN